MFRSSGRLLGAFSRREAFRLHPGLVFQEISPLSEIFYLTEQRRCAERCFNHSDHSPSQGFFFPLQFLRRYLPTGQDNYPQTRSGTSGRPRHCHYCHPDISTADLWRSNTPFFLQSLEPPSPFKANVD